MIVGNRDLRAGIYGLLNSHLDIHADLTYTQSSDKKIG